MVNYCCVKGCRKNSRTDSKLNFYSLPKEKKRQIKWLKACGRENLLEEKAKNSLRFCSTHFEPLYMKNRLLTAAAVPTLNLDGSDDLNNASNKVIHEDILCDNCNKPVTKFRYKCVTCKNYDLCHLCEGQEAHSHHYMIRVPIPAKDKIVKDLRNKVAKKLKSKVKTESQINFVSSDSSDNEPITKYVTKNNIQLPDNVKKRIQDEVTRVLNLKFGITESINEKDTDVTFVEVTKSEVTKSEVTESELTKSEPSKSETSKSEDSKSEVNKVEISIDFEDSIDEQFFGFLKRKKPLDVVYVGDDGREQDCILNQGQQINIEENILELR